MATDAILTVFDEMRKRALRIDDKNPSGQKGFVFSLLPVGLPINPADFANPWTPGMGVEPDAAIMRRRYATHSNLSRFLNHKLEVNGSGNVMPGAASISDTWNAILTGAESLPPPAPNPQALQRFNEARAFLYDVPAGGTNSVFNTYSEYAALYGEAQVAYTDAYQNAMATAAGAAGWALNGRAHIQKVKTALNRWELMGRKQEVEARLATVKSQGSNVVEAVIARARETFQNWQIAGDGIPDLVPAVQTTPSNWADPGATGGWYRYQYSEERIHAAHSEETTSWGASAGVSFGFWSVGGHGGGSTTRIHDEFSSQGLKIEFTYGLVTIDRPWLSTLLLNLKGWKILHQAKGVVSNGTAVQNVAPDGGAFWLPALPTQMIVLKNIRLWTADIERVYDFARTQSQAGGSVGWGPFSIGGSYSRYGQSSSTNCRMEDGWLAIDGTQLTGWVSQILPLSPAESGL